MAVGLLFGRPHLAARNCMTCQLQISCSCLKGSTLNLYHVFRVLIVEAMKQLSLRSLQAHRLRMSDPMDPAICHRRTQRLVDTNTGRNTTPGFFVL